MEESKMVLRTEDLVKKYGKRTVVSHVSIDVKQGEIVGLLGPNGAGKTTSFYMTVGLITPNEGRIFLDDLEITKFPVYKRAQTGIGYLAQEASVFRQMSVEDNIAAVLEMTNKPKEYQKEKLESLIAEFRLQKVRKNKGNQLSGGERRRTEIARCLAIDPKFIMLDEPFAAIDAKVRQELRSWLKDMIERLGVTSIFVTHDQSEAIEVADEIIITNKGRIEQIGSPIDIYQHPDTAFSASFFGQTTTLDDYTKFKTFDVVDNVDRAVIRPEFVKVTKLSETTAQKASVSVGEVIKTSFRGDNIEIAVKCDGGTVYAYRGLDETPITVGEKVNVFLYRLFITKGDEVQILRNKSLQEESVII